MISHLGRLEARKKAKVDIIQGLINQTNLVAEQINALNEQRSQLIQDALKVQGGIDELNEQIAEATKGGQKTNGE